MSETEEKFDNNNGDSCDKSDEEVSASHFALQIALQTMKERCQLLQQRLSAVEEENLRLRIDSQSNSRKNVEVMPASEISKLEEKITQLSRQKCQLIDRITMVAKENNHLWTRLSRVTQVNQSLGNHLTKISDTLNKHPIGDTSNKINESELINDSSSKLLCDLNKEESLEEISLKIIDTIRREKKVLEKQCEEMVELQTGAASVEECGFTLTANGDIATGGGGVIEDAADNNDGESVMEDVRRLREKMQREYKLLRDQQAGLHAAIASLNILIADYKNCKCKGAWREDNRNTNKHSKDKSHDSNAINITTMLSPMDEIQKQLQQVAEPPPVTPSDCNMGMPPERSEEELLSNNLVENNNDTMYKYVDDRICPLCSKFYCQKVPFEEFHDHVLSHFNNEGPEDDSLISNFESHS